MCRNPVWASALIVGVCLWLRLELRTPAQNRYSLAALAIVFFLFPPVSHNNDISLVRNAPETNSFQNCENSISSPQLNFPKYDLLPKFAASQLSFDSRRRARRMILSLPTMAQTTPEATWSRPPPEA